MARWTRRLGIFTIALTFVAVVSAAISFFQWKTLEKSDQTLRKTVEATQRPWLKFEVTITENIKPDIHAKLNPFVGVKVSLKNYGNGVASHVRANMAIVSDGLVDGTYKMAGLYRHLLCYQARKFDIEGENDLGVTVFPNETESRDAIAEVDFRTLGLGEPNEKYFLIGCGIYHSYFSERPYRIEFVYTIETDLPFKDGEEMSVKAMRLKKTGEDHGAY